MFTHSAKRFLGATLLLLGDQLAELGLGVGASLGVLSGEAIGLGLRIGERGGELVGLLALAGEGVLLVVDLRHEGIEFVGGHVAGTQRDPSEFLTLHRVVQVLGVLEQGPERHGSTADERSQRHVGQAGAQHVQLGLLLGDAGFGVGDLDVELRLGVDRFVVVLTELTGTLFELLELVDDVFDLLALLVDALRIHDRRQRHRNGEGDGEGDRKAAQELLEGVPHSSRSHPSEYDERVANA